MEYLPFYGGAKGQYLELKKDKFGVAVSQKIIDGRDNIIGSNIDTRKKTTEAPTESPVSDSTLDEEPTGARLAAAVGEVKRLSTEAGKILNAAVSRGTITTEKRARLQILLTSLTTAMESATDLINDSGENLEFLIRRRPTPAKYDDDVGEEGVGIDSSEEPSFPGFPGHPGGILGGALIAEAKPVGLAVIGENGLAAARPIGTAVASSGVAIARPVGTAIAGIDPTLLGINFQVNKS